MTTSASSSASYTDRFRPLESLRSTPFDGDDPTWAIAATASTGFESRPVAQEPNELEGAVTRGGFWPEPPSSLSETGLRESHVEALTLKYLLNMGFATGRDIANQIALPFGLMQPLFSQFKDQQLLSIKAAGPLGDFQYELTALGVDRARRHAQQGTYFGAAPVSLEQYFASVAAQSTRNHRLTPADVQRAFQHLVLSANVTNALGEALHLGRGLFLHGAPGNGKSSLAVRSVHAYSPVVWIPRALSVGGEVVRLFDSIHHVPVADDTLNSAQRTWDRRWICIERPAIVVGSEMQLSSLEVTTNPLTRISEAPLQLKANCGTLVIDDFGRNRFRPEELLNRLVVPLERHTDSLHLDSGRTFQIPFDCFIVFSSNLDPAQLVDEAFLRRIPFKVRVEDPTPAEFCRVFAVLANAWDVRFRESDLKEFVERFYLQAGQPLRFCHPRDLLQIVKNACEFHGRPQEATPRALEEAVERYRIQQSQTTGTTSRSV